MCVSVCVQSVCICLCVSVGNGVQVVWFMLFHCPLAFFAWGTLEESSEAFLTQACVCVCVCMCVCEGVCEGVSERVCVCACVYVCLPSSVFCGGVVFLCLLFHENT